MATTADEILSGGVSPSQTPVANSVSSGTQSAIVPSEESNDAPSEHHVAAAETQVTTDKPQVIEVSDRQKDNNADKPSMSYVEMFKELSPYKPPSAEDLEKERKRQKREAIFATIGDGIAAMSNLYFTTQYAPSSFDPTSGMTATTKARFDKLKQDREANQRAYMDGYLRAMKMDADAARDDRNYQHTLEREKVTDRYKEAAEVRAQAKADRDAAMAELRMELMQERISQQEAAARAEEIEANYAEAYWQSRINKNNYRPVKGGNNGATKKYPVFNADGDVIDHVYTEVEAVSETERNGGTYTGKTKVQTQTQKDGRREKNSEVSTTTTPTAGRTPRSENEKPKQETAAARNSGNEKPKRKTGLTYE